AEARIGFRRDALERLARIELVLDGEHRRERRMGEPEAPGDERGDERAELLVGSDDRIELARAIAAHEAFDEGERVEGEEPRVVGEAEEVEALEEELEALPVAGVARRRAIPLVREQHQDPSPHAAILRRTGRVGCPRLRRAHPPRYWPPSSSCTRPPSRSSWAKRPRSPVPPSWCGRARHTCGPRSRGWRACPRPCCSTC